MHTPAATFAIGDAVVITDGSCKDGQVAVIESDDGPGYWYLRLSDDRFWHCEEKEMERVSE